MAKNVAKDENANSNVKKDFSSSVIRDIRIVFNEFLLNYFQKFSNMLVFVR